MSKLQAKPQPQHEAIPLDVRVRILPARDRDGNRLNDPYIGRIGKVRGIAEGPDGVVYVEFDADQGMAAGFFPFTRDRIAVQRPGGFLARRDDAGNVVVGA